MTTMTAEQTSSKKINEGIKAVSTNYAKANQSVQDVGLMVLAHAMAFGDCTGAARLIDAMPNSARRGLVVDWFTKYSPINVSKGDGSKMKANLRETADKKYNSFNLDGATANPWFETTKKDKELEAALDLTAARGVIYGVIQKLEKQANDAANENEKLSIQTMLANVRLAILPKQIAA